MQSCAAMRRARKFPPSTTPRGASSMPRDWSAGDLPPRPAEADGPGTAWRTGVLPTRIGPFDTKLSQGGPHDFYSNGAINRLLIQRER